MMGYLLRRLGWNRPTAQVRQVVNNTINDTLSETVGTMEQRIGERFAEIEQAVNELAEHVDGVVEIVTSVAEESAANTENLKALTDRVSRNAHTLVETKDLLNKTIDSIDWEDEHEPAPVYDTAAPVQPEVYQRPYVPPLPPPTPAPPIPTKPLPFAPAIQPAPPSPAKPQPNEIEPPVEQVPLVGPRSETDPLITDLRAVPFQDHPDAYNDMHTLPPSAEYSEWGAPGGSRRSSRTNGLRNRLR